jgi:hypothetical protein
LNQSAHSRPTSHPSVMYFYSGPPMHFLSGVDTQHLADRFKDAILPPVFSPLPS